MSDMRLRLVEGKLQLSVVVRDDVSRHHLVEKGKWRGGKDRDEIRQMLMIGDSGFEYQLVCGFNLAAV
jgi:hypothetical protein